MAEVVPGEHLEGGSLIVVWQQEGYVGCGIILGQVSCLASGWKAGAGRGGGSTKGM